MHPYFIIVDTYSIVFQAILIM